MVFRRPLQLRNTLFIQVSSNDAIYNGLLFAARTVTDNFLLPNSHPPLPLTCPLPILGPVWLDISKPVFLNLGTCRP